MSEAPERIWAGKYRSTWWQSSPHHQMTEYVRADLVQSQIDAEPITRDDERDLTLEPAEPRQPTVKHLEWVDLHGDGSLYQTDVDHPLGYYAVINRRGCYGWSYLEEFFDTLAEAKAAAQADYERRILSALIIEPDDA